MKSLAIFVCMWAMASAEPPGFVGGFGVGGGGGGFPVQNPSYVGGGGGGYSHGGGAVGVSNVGGGGYSGAGGMVGNPAGGFGSGYNSGGSFSGGNVGLDAAPPAFIGGGGQIRKFVSVHVAPDDPQFTQTKVIRAGGPPDRHVNIIFVKAPSASSQQNTEVILPEAPQQKTLVYVLVKKAESHSDIRVRGPAPTKPPKPEVYFIRYKDTVGPPVPPSPVPGGFVGNVGGGGAPAFRPPQSGGPVGGGYK